MVFSSYEQALVKLLMQKNWVQSQVMSKTLEYIKHQRQQGQKISIESFLLNHNYISQQNLQTAVNMISSVMSSSTQMPFTTQQPVMNASRFTQTQVIQNIQQQKTIAHYNIEKELGRGGMGVVFKATDTKLGRTVAVKVIIGTTLTEKKIRRFLEEAKATARLKHPHIISLYEINNTPVNYFTMEYVDGKPLSDYVGKGLKLKEVLYIMNKCASAIDFAHNEGIVHRDIKPSNIMLDRLKNPKVMDFGLAKDVNNDQKISRQGDVMGTPAYMSPEQASGVKVDARSDVYSLGATMYQMLVGRPPFQADSYWKVLKKLHIDEPMRPRSLNPDIPLEVEAICMKCLEKKPSKRYQTAISFAKDIENFLKDKPVHASPITFISRLLKSIKRNKLIFSLCFILALVIINSSVYIVYQYLQLQSINKNLSVKQKELLQLNKKLQKSQQTEKEAKQQAEIREYYANIHLANQYVKDFSSKEAMRTLENCPEFLRNWEWSWLKSMSDTSSIVPDAIAKIKQPITVAAYSDLIVIGNKAGNVIVYNTKRDTKKILKVTNKEIKYCLFSNSGQYLAVLSKATAFIFDTKTWRIKSKLKHENTCLTCIFFEERYLIVGYEIKNISFRDRKTLSEKQKQNLVVWDIANAKVVKFRSANTYFDNDVNSMAFVGDNLILVGGDSHRTQEKYNRELLTIWNPKTQKEKKISKAPRLYHKGKINRVVVGEFVATVSEDNSIIIMNKKLQPIRQLKAHKSGVSYCVFSPNNQYLLSVSYDHTIIVWSMKDFSRITTLIGHTQSIYSCAFSGENKIISCGADGVKFWNVNFQEKHITTGNPYVFPKEQYAITDCKIHPRKQNIAFATEYGLAVTITNFRGQSLIYKDNPGEMKAFSGSMGPVRFLQFHPQKQIIANGSDIGLVMLFNTENGERIRKYSGHKINKHVRHCTFNDNGTRLASASYDSTIRIWNSDIKNKSFKNEGNPIFVLEGATDDLNVASFHPKNETIAGCGYGAIFIWNIDENPHNGKRNVRLQPIKRMPVKQETFFCAYSKDGRYLVSSSSGEENLVVRDSRTLKIIHSFSGHNDRVEVFAFIPNYPDRLASASHDGTIRIWNMKKIGQEKESQPILTIPAHNKGVKALSFSSDGNTMVSGGLDHYIKVWHLNKNK
ncbi:protein kinase [Candidatus Uabimicrobium sp. HlEnr_7]|uniref:protein kinase domain-containing protein n=1 Tax=Candidatus Uabimicrobium helgolandensis TaxID=3095367 RepID=UPI003556816E